jgi:hypothetical protein
MPSAVMLNAVMVNVVAPLVVLAQSCHILTEITSNSETDVSSICCTIFGAPKKLNILIGTVHFKKCKQWFEYKHLLLLRDIWWSKF